MRQKQYLFLRLALLFRPNPNPIRSLTEIERILVISTTAIGDTLLSTPIIRALRDIYPRATIKGLFRDRFCPLFASNPDLDGIIPFRKGWIGFLKLFRSLKKEKFDAAFVLHTSDPRPVGLAGMAGIPFITGKSLHRQFDDLFDEFTRPDYRFHAIDRRMAVLKRLYPEHSHWPKRLVLPLENGRKETIWKTLESRFRIPRFRGPVVALQPGASRDFKMWPRERFIALGRLLIERYPNLVIVILGGADEFKLGDSVAKGVGMPDRVFTLCGETRIEELPYVISGLDLLITNDTGSFHIAIAVCTQTVSLFVPTDVHGTGPYQDQDKHIVISKPKPCDFRCVQKRCPHKPSCMTLISVDEVYNAACLVLDGSPAGRLASG